MILLVTMKKRSAGVIRNQIDLDLALCFDHHDIFIDAAGGNSPQRNQFKRVPMEMDGVIVRAAVIEDQTVTQSLFQNHGFSIWK